MIENNKNTQEVNTQAVYDLFAKEGNKELINDFKRFGDKKICEILAAFHVFTSYMEQLGFSSEHSIINQHNLDYIKQHHPGFFAEHIEADGMHSKKYILSMIEKLSPNPNDHSEVKELIKKARLKYSAAANVSVKKLSHSSTIDMIKYDVILNVISAYDTAVEERRQLKDTVKDQKQLQEGYDKIISKFISTISRDKPIQCREIFAAMYEYYNGTEVPISEYEDDINNLKILQVQKTPQPSGLKRIFSTCARRHKQTPNEIFSKNIDALTKHLMSTQDKDCITVSKASFASSYQYENDRDSRSSNGGCDVIHELEEEEYKNDQSQKIETDQTFTGKLLAEKQPIQAIKEEEGPLQPF